MKNQFLLLFFVVFSNLCYATPDDGVREHDVLIGYNENYYYSFKTINYPSGTYYANRDSAFLIERELKSGKLISKIFISSRYHRDSTSYGDWRTKEYVNSKFNYIEYLSEKNIKYLYPSIYKYSSYRRLWFEVDFDGLKLMYKQEKELIAELDLVEVYAPWIRKYLQEKEKTKQKYPNSKREYVKAACLIGDNDYVFLIIIGEMNADYLQSILPLKKEELSKKARETIN